MNEWSSIKRALLRALRVFITTGIASMVIIPPTNLNEIDKWALNIAIAFIAGGLSGISKYIRDEYLVDLRIL